MRLPSWLKRAWYMIRGYSIIRVENEEQIETIQTFFGIPGDVIPKVITLGEPSYGRLATFSFDKSTPDGIKAYECIKELSKVNNSETKITMGEDYITFEFTSFEDAEDFREPWKQYRDMQLKPE